MVTALNEKNETVKLIDYNITEVKHMDRNSKSKEKYLYTK